MWCISVSLPEGCSTTDPIDNHSVYRLLVQKTFQSVLLETTHDKWGHKGVARTYSILKSKCHWPGMHGQIKSYIRRCVQCTVAKAPHTGKGGIEDVL